MHELICPGCNAPSQYDLKDIMHMCPFCSATFGLDYESGKKELYADHYIIPNALEPRQIRDLVLTWIKRMHHNPDLVEKEYYIVDINGYSIPYWIISMEAHSSWKGLVQRNHSNIQEHSDLPRYIAESGRFRRDYRWAVSARRNMTENWGMVRLHVPKESILVDWDGFPLDSTFSRGRLDQKTGVKTSKDSLEAERSAYEVREYFEFKYSNGLPILAIQVNEDEAVRRARSHVERYHLKISQQYVDVHMDTRTELEIAGIQLVHMPFWHIRYVYRPDNLLRHLGSVHTKNVLMEGYTGGILEGELSIIYRDKLWINSLVSLFAAVAMIFLGIVWHPSFFFVAFFCMTISGASAYVASVRKARKGSETSSFFYSGKTETAGSSTSEPAKAKVE